AFATSLTIEILQRFTGRGIFDLDDILNNFRGQ
ncbi:MAG TPA: VanZ family protein, partial [Clostridium sp.]|nr:VanZ family protein [Clostridium sp.]